MRKKDEEALKMAAAKLPKKHGKTKLIAYGPNGELFYKGTIADFKKKYGLNKKAK